MQTSIRDLKDHLSNYLRRVQRGEEIIVTSHRRPVVKLVPVADDQEEARLSREACLRELNALREELTGAVRGKPLSRLVLKMRKEGRC